jgi:alginate O-acetyltransferase complex protein AlgI
MVFTSTLFLLYFLPIFLVMYAMAPYRWKNGVALAASLLFYAWGAPTFIVLLLGLLIANFYLVKHLDLSNRAPLRKALLWCSLAINLGVLGYFKYANFFVENVNAFLGWTGNTALQWTAVALPIGISFFTFQSITYTLDVYWKKHARLNQLADYLLYILLFPQLIAGPIIRFNTIADEINNRKGNLTADNKLHGFYIFAIGLAKKVLIANQLGEQVDLIFSQGNTLSTGMAWLGVLGYSMQIYFDFSGYSDMAIGLGRMMGFHFPENFKNPYTATSITDFWRKWHITLGTFMRDYLYIPLGGNRSGSKWRTYFNLIAVFLLSGLWHGASWNFVIWGGWFGLFLILERMFLEAWLNRWPKLVQLGYAFLVVLLGWVFFRAETLPDALHYLKTMVGAGSISPVAIEVDPSFIPFLVLAFAFAWLTLWKWGRQAEHFVFYRQHSTKTHMLLVPLALVLTVLCISYVASSDFNPFIYFRF